MTATETFEMILAMLCTVALLYWLAERLRWPPSAALLLGGGAIAFIPGVPTIELDPELVLVLFLPPLLVDGAWNTELASFKRHLAGILSLAVGAVVFSVIVLAATVHWLIPSLPWAACAALGAIVAPPDAVAARAVLARVSLPRRLSALLEGESLLNDATGLVIFRFAVAAVAGANIDAGQAAGRFLLLVVGGAAVGLAIGAVWVWLARRMTNELLLIVATTLVGWIAYLIGESLGLSGVISAVAAGLILGWKQHEIFSAAVRVRGASFWQVLVFVLEASVFILIGLSLRDVLDRAGGLGAVVQDHGGPLAAIVTALVVARFVWVFACDAIVIVFRRAGITRRAPLGPASASVLAWAGMRGVVTLAAALTLPASFPERDLILLAAFASILVTVLIQGSTLGLIVRTMGVRRSASDEAPVGLLDAEMAMMRAQLTAVETLARDENGTVIHPQLLRRYASRVTASGAFTGNNEARALAIASHFDIVLAAVAAGRTELVRLHRGNRIDDETLRSLEMDLDLDELAAHSAKA